MTEETLYDRVSTNLDEEEYNQVIEWIWNARQGQENAVWFLGSVKPKRSINKSTRGEFVDGGDIWHPNEAEKQACCEKVKTSDDTPEERYALIAHCQTKEHVRALVASLDNRGIRKEFHRMNKAIAKTLENMGA